VDAKENVFIHLGRFALSLYLSLLFLSYRIVLVMYLGDSSGCAKDLALSLPVRRRIGQKRCIYNGLSS
jgi:hypothetical protein